MPHSFPDYSFTCPFCKNNCKLSFAQCPAFCPFCGKSQKNESTGLPIQSDFYQIIKSIGKGGMGEVFLAYDPCYERQIAIKKIRSDLLEHPQIKKRFLKEAHMTSQLTHPAIIPIYTIRSDADTAYYTMPFVEGDTLKQIIRKTKLQEKNGETLDYLGGSILALMRVFITICQAVAYAHSKGVLHRDLKPENIIIGKYGEVLILDWGLAKFIDQSPEEELLASFPESLTKQKDITKIGKVVGTVAYMAPERALGQPATIQTDIYSLGVILYQLLTLKSPFKRGTLDEFRKNMSREEWQDPVTAAPYREVPRMLASFTEKCLSLDLQNRYQSVEELIRDIENYLEGRSEWFCIANLNTKEKNDWEFQENVLIAEHVAITRMTDDAEWVSLMISKQSFTGNTKIEADVCLGEQGHGIGFLLSVPEASAREHLIEGYCLWLGSDFSKTTKLLRSNVEVVHAPDIFLKRQQTYHVRIEKVDKSIHVYINDNLQFSYIAHIPLIGTHVGLLSRDADFEISPLEIYVGNLNINVNCLAVPDAFLAHRDYNQALSEYRRIAYSFPDRTEGREALFRAGLTFLEQAKTAENKMPLLEEALNEFEKLHGTPSAPLEYLGKALAYESINDSEEEIKCYELAYRRYPNHPILPMLQEQIISRLHEVSRMQRITTYRFTLLTVRHLPLNKIDTHTKRLFNSLQKHWEVLPFIEYKSPSPLTTLSTRFATPLAFWLAKPFILGEILDDLIQSPPFPIEEVNNALLCLVELGSWEYAQEKLNTIQTYLNLPQNPKWLDLKAFIACHYQTLEDVYKDFFFQIPSTNADHLHAVLYFMDQCLDQLNTSLIYTLARQFEHAELSFEDRLRLNCRRVWAYLLDKNWQDAGNLLYTYSVETLNKNSSLLHFLYGCWLQVTEGAEIANVHFAGVNPVMFPRTWTLGARFLTNNLSKDSYEKAFMWEKRQLCKQLILYYHCVGNETKRIHFQKLYQEQFIHAEL